MKRRDFLSSAAAGAAALGLPSTARSASSGDAAPEEAPRAPLAMWALTGRLESDDVRRQFDQFHAAGWGVVLYPRWGLDVEYLSDAFLDRVRFAVDEAAARGMEAWLYDEFCWPSGHAKGLVTKDREDLVAELLEVRPDGRTSVTRVPGSANLLMPEATRRFLEVTHERYAAAVGGHFGRCVRAIFADEPSLALRHAPPPPGASAWRLSWSKDLDRALGGDFRERLASAKDLPRWPGWRDYWKAYSQVFHDAWAAPIARWCREHRIAMSGHLLGEHGFGSQVAFNGSLRHVLGAFGLPGIDEISTRVEIDQCEALTLSAISGFPGRERMCEVYALGPPYMTMNRMRAMVDLCSACGVDRYVVAICPHNLRGGVFKREYLGVYGPQQPWFRDYARDYTDHVAAAAGRARRAQPLDVPWPADEELWAAAGPDPARSAALKEMTGRAVAAAREAIRARLTKEPAIPPPDTALGKTPILWSFQVRGLNSLRLDSPVLSIVDLPARAELSVQSQLVRALRVNGKAVDLAAAPPDRDFDTSYRRVPVAALLHAGENRFEIESDEPKPLKFLPALILWGDFGVDAQGRLAAPPKAIPLGDWRKHGFPALCGTGCYRGVAECPEPPVRLTLDTGRYPVRVTMNGRFVGRRAWPPFHFDVKEAARPGRNEILIEITSTLGHLFVPKEAAPVGLLAAEFEFA